MKLFNQKVRIVLSHFKEGMLGDSEKFVGLIVVGIVGKMIEVKAVDVDEDVGDKPEERKGVDLKIREKGEAKHV